ncbi:hypothetical protein [[Pseudomonas] boreopolis]|uniref:hypothetical protein n=1 Tax=Xanthomonas boreopolis TaxID=86183 RepID=UPI003DA058C8
MKVLILALLLAPLSVMAADSEAPLACESGPVQREFAKATWNIYACADDKSVVVVPLSAINGEFGYFFVTSNGQEIVVAGEGWGQHASFQPVLQRLKQLTLAELAALADAARMVKPAVSPTP